MGSGKAQILPCLALAKQVPSPKPEALRPSRPTYQTASLLKQTNSTSNYDCGSYCPPSFKHPLLGGGVNTLGNSDLKVSHFHWHTDMTKLVGGLSTWRWHIKCHPARHLSQTRLSAVYTAAPGSLLLSAACDNWGTEPTVGPVEATWKS